MGALGSRLVCAFVLMEWVLCWLSHLLNTGHAFLQVQNSVASLANRKTAPMVHTETVVQGAKAVQKSKAPTPSQDMGHKAQPAPRVRKTKTPENTKKPELPRKTSSKAPSKKAEASS